MNVRCPICMRPLPVHQAEIKHFGARGRALFAVHRERCADVVEAGCYVGSVALIAQGRKLFAQKAPMLSALFERYAASRRAQAAPLPNVSRETWGLHGSHK